MKEKGGCSHAIVSIKEVEGFIGGSAMVVGEENG